MEIQTTETENSSFPAIYQCIVCQMTTISLSRLHRHQTYQHTPEELSLSTIGLQCSFINNVHATKSIVYDNSWLCDPLKQAEFYTVSASLLNDCNNNANDCNPVDYVVEKESRIFKEEEDDVEIPKELKMCNFSRIDHNYQLQASFASDSPENGTQTKKFRSVGTETNRTDFPKDANQSEASLDVCTEAERIITYFEEIMQVEEIVTNNEEANYDSESLGKVAEAEEIKNVDGEAICLLKSTEKETKVEEPKVCYSEANSSFKSVEKEPNAEESKFVDFDAKRSFKSTEKEETKAEEPEADLFVNCINSLCDDLEKIKNKPTKRKRAPPRNPPPRKAKAVAKPKAPRKKAKIVDSVTENNAITQKIDQQTEISMKNESESINFTELSLNSQKTKNSVKPLRKKAKISHSVAENKTIQQKVDQETQNSLKDYSAELNLETQKTEKSVELPRKKAKTSNSIPENTKIMEDANKKIEIPTQNDFPIINHTEFSLEIQKTEISDDLPEKRAQTFNSASENIKIMQEVDQKIENTAQNFCASTNHNEVNFESEKTGNSVKKIFSDEDIVEAQLAALFREEIETQESEISMIHDSASSQWISCNLVKMEPGIYDEQELENDNCIQNYVDTCKAEIPAEIPIEIKSEDLEIHEEIDPKNCDQSEDSVVAALPSPYTFPWYPSDINDYSILVLDPEAHQLVWTEVAIVDEEQKLKSENLPELTDADLRNNEICENVTISSGSQTKENAGNFPRSQTNGNATKKKKKPHTNFVLRPRKTATKKML